MLKAWVRLRHYCPAEGTIKRRSSRLRDAVRLAQDRCYVQCAVLRRQLIVLVIINMKCSFITI